MNDSNELEALRAKVADLEAQIAHDNDSRRELLTNTSELLPRLVKTQEGWERLFAAHRNALEHQPELAAMREEGLLPKFAILASRQRAVEEQFAELRSLAVETYTAFKEILELLKHGAEEGGAE